MKQVFGRIEAVFNLFYLTVAFVLGFILLCSVPDNFVRRLAGIMALVLAGGDTFHLLPRILLVFSGNGERMRQALGNGKLVTSITMTVFYVLLWQLGLLVFTPVNIWLFSAIVHILAVLRVALCFLPQSKWHDRSPPTVWGIRRNIPFILQGAMVTGLFFRYRHTVQEIGLVWLAITLSYIFYIPVVVWVRKYPKIGMLMLPKSCAYLWLLSMFLAL